MRLISRIGMVLMLGVAVPALTYAQYADALSQAGAPAGGPFSNVAVTNAPFSADATTVFRENLPDGSVREHTLTARYYRDSAGRVRAELDTAWGQYVVVGEPGPTDRMSTWVLEPTTRAYRFAAHYGTELFNGEGRVVLPVGKACFQIAPSVLPGAPADERLRAVNAQVSPDLRIVIASHRADSLGTVDYRVTNIRREEPPSKLFEVPPEGYTVASGFDDDPFIAYAPWQSKHVCAPVTR